ncbi:MAG: NTP transferase domain-containing protein [Clostridiales bacterium]|nr:NTP transferase domain-containing protein [Clostridiales bacterium]
MKAIIMAGGEGSRLRPLTCDIPKPMARLCGRPVLVYILDLLAAHGVTQAAVTLRYLPEAVTEYFPDNRYAGIDLRFVEETEPLGTAGGVKNAAAGFIEAEADREGFIVISGDALCDADLTAAFAFHHRSGADATLLTSRVADPREYGLVDCDEQGVVTGFVEKPSWIQAYTDQANTGIYILKPSCLDMIPEGQPYDFAKDLFGQMLQQERKLCAFEEKGYWCDIGDLDSYRRCQSDILAGRVKTYGRQETKSHQPPRGDYRIIEPAYIGEGVTIGCGAVIGPGAVLDDGVTVGAMARIKESILLPDAYAGDRSQLTGAVLCAGASVKTGGALFEGAAVGPGSVVGKGAAVLPGVRVWPGKRLPDGARLADNLRMGQAEDELFDDDGISGEAGVELNPAFCAKVGMAAGSLKCGGRVGVASAGGRAAAAMKMAFTAGVLSTGAHVWDFGEIMESQMSFAVAYCGLQAGVYISGGPTASLKLIGEGGLPAGRSLERELEGHLRRGEFARCAWNSYPDVADMDGIKLLYQQELYACAPRGLAGMAARVNCAGREEERLLADTLARLGCEIGEGPAFNISRSGEKLSIADRQAGYLRPEQVLCMCCIMEFEEGRDVALPFDAPRMIDSLAAKYGRRVERYFSCPADGTDRPARQAAVSQLWLRDGMMMTLRLLDRMKTTGRSLSELAAEVPKFALLLRSVDLPSTVASAFSSLPAHREAAGEGMRIKSQKGLLFLKPDKRGRRMKLLVEAANSETAEELCAETEAVLLHGVDTDAQNR